MPDPPEPALLAAILADPDDGPGGSPWPGGTPTTGEPDLAAVMRVYWPALRDTLAAGRYLDYVLARVQANAARLGRGARAFEERGV